MNTNKHLLIAAAVVLATLSVTGKAHAGFRKWWNTEVKPTLQGKRQLRIKPYVKLSHRGNQVLLRKNAFKIKLGGVTLQTTDLRRFVARGACVYATGAYLRCMGPALYREVRRMKNRLGNGGRILGGNYNHGGRIPGGNYNHGRQYPNNWRYQQQLRLQRERWLRYQQQLRLRQLQANPYWRAMQCRRFGRYCY